MNRLRACLFRLVAWPGRQGREREWSAEFESHLQMHIDDNLPAGINAAEARRLALVKFGGIESAKESMRDRAGFFLWSDTTQRDVRYALRNLRRSPGFTVTTLLSLALGLGASLAVFTIADNMLLRPLPYRDASRLVDAVGNRSKTAGHRTQRRLSG